ncbi:MAG: hypothetical protein IJ587_12040, partial [Synergistaceae bacterium]|nr:hypothetical protein [Synergistaceae bacterium]
IKHLEMIENIIQRIASTSFKLKGWAIVLIGLIGGIASREYNKNYLFLLLLILFPLITFCFLDAFYLQLERKYRVLYKNICDDDIENFSMDLTSIIPHGNDTNRIHYWNCFFSLTELGFYLPIILTVINFIMCVAGLKTVYIAWSVIISFLVLICYYFHAFMAR